MKLMFGKGEALAAAVEEVNKQLEVLAGLLDKQQGPWLMGEAFSLADAALAPWILRMPVGDAAVYVWLCYSCCCVVLMAVMRLDGQSRPWILRMPAGGCFRVLGLVVLDAAWQGAAGAVVVFCPGPQRPQLHP